MNIYGAVRVFATLMLVVAIAPPGVFAQGRSDEALAALERVRHVSDEVLVQFVPGATELQKNVTRDRIRSERRETVVSEHRRKDGGGDLELLRLPPGRTVAEAIRGLETDDVVRFVEPNWIYRHSEISNDPYYVDGSLWGMYGDATSPANPYGSQAGEAWEKGITDCGDVYVGIIDEGRYPHKDLAANIGTNPGEIPRNRRDDDGNGYVDDFHGWNFVRNNNIVFDGIDDNHGTHVAGTIGGVGGNGEGVAGVCWKVKLIVAKFLGEDGGSLVNAIKAVDYMTDLKVRHGLKLVATNNSWGGSGYSQALRNAIERANAAGILFVAAAGNGGSDGIGDDNDVTPYYPSSFNNANIIAVASITNTGAISTWSNYGAVSVDLAAPGSDIFSTVPILTRTDKKKSTISSGYASYSGTSMAAPHVTGAIALYAAQNPNASAEEIKNAILGMAMPTDSLLGKCVTGGRLDMSSF